jgi:hypothetical protein
MTGFPIWAQLENHDLDCVRLPQRNGTERAADTTMARTHWIGPRAIGIEGSMSPIASLNVDSADSDD